MKQRILRQSVYPILKLIFKIEDNKVWISIDTARGDKKFIDIASHCLNKIVHKKLCEELCERVDKIYNIKVNEEKIKNAINSIDKKENKLPILNMSLVSQNVFDIEKSEFKHNVIPRISLCTEAKHIQEQNEFKKLHNLFICANGNNGLNIRMFDLLMDIYILAIKSEYDLFAILEED